jgi:hypothetical protein
MTAFTYTHSCFWDIPFDRIALNLIRLINQFMIEITNEVKAEQGISLQPIPSSNVVLGRPGKIESTTLYLELDSFSTIPNDFTRKEIEFRIAINSGVQSTAQEEMRRSIGHCLVIERLIQKIFSATTNYRELLVGWPANLYAEDPVNTARINQIHNHINILFKSIQSLPDTKAGKDTFGTEAGLRIKLLLICDLRQGVTV